MTRPNSCEDCGQSEGVKLYCAYPARLCDSCAQRRVETINEATTELQTATKNER